MSYKETELDTGVREIPISCFLERRALQTEVGADLRRKMLTRREVLRREIPDTLMVPREKPHNAQ